MYSTYLSPKILIPRFADIYAHIKSCWEKSIDRKSINRLLMHSDRAHYVTFRKKCFISYVHILHVNNLVSIDTYV